MDSTEEVFRSPARKKPCPAPAKWIVAHSIKVYNLTPGTFMERSITTVFEKQRMKHNIEAQCANTVVRCVNFPRENHFYIEFINADIACRVASLRLFYPQDNLIVMEAPTATNVSLLEDTFAPVLSSTPVKCKKQLDIVRNSLLPNDSNNNVPFQSNDLPPAHHSAVKGNENVAGMLNLSIHEDELIPDVYMERTSVGVGLKNAEDVIPTENVEDVSCTNYEAVAITKDNEENDCFKYSKMVSAVGLPANFEQNDLDVVLQAYLQKGGARHRYNKIIRNVSKMKDSVLIELLDEKLAKAVMDLKIVHFLAEEVRFSGAVPPPQEVTKVTASGFTNFQPAIEHILDKTLKAYLIKKRVIQAGDEIIVKVHYSNDTTSVVIELFDERLARATSDLKQIHVNADVITLKLVDENCPKAAEVYAFNVSEMHEQIFTMALEAFLEKHNCEHKRPNVPIIKKIHPQVGTCIKIEVATEDLAVFICDSLKTIYYLADLVEFRRTPMLVRNVSMDTSDFVSHDTTADAQGKPPVTSLVGDWATQCFLHECCRFKMNDKTASKFLGTDGALTAISAALRQKYNILVGAADCKRRKKTLDEQHRRGPHDRWAPYMAYLRGETTVIELQDIAPQEMSFEEDILSSATFTKGAVMKFEEELCLIDVWRELKDEYRAAHKDVPFYKKISAQLVLRGINFSHEQCKLKMDTLRKEFSMFVLASKKSGAGRPGPWPYYDHLRPILEDLVSVTAQETFAVGAACVATHNKKVAPMLTNQARRGKERPRPQSQASSERRELVNMMVESRKALLEELRQFRTAGAKPTE